MPATKRQFNITSCVFTATGGSATTYTGVTAANPDLGGTLAKFSGDGDRFATTVINEFNEPSVTVTTADIAASLANPPGTRGSLVFASRDAKSATGGLITYTVTTAIVRTVQATNQHRQFSTATVIFDTESADGATNPISFALT